MTALIGALIILASFTSGLTVRGDDTGDAQAPQGSKIMRDTTTSAKRATTIPPIDASLPERIETATFALG